MAGKDDIPDSLEEISLRMNGVTDEVCPFFPFFSGEYFQACLSVRWNSADGVRPKIFAVQKS